MIRLLILSSTLTERLLACPRWVKRTLALVFDTCACGLTLWVAVGLRLETWGMLNASYVLMLVVCVGMALLTFVRLGLYRAIFRYSGANGIRMILKAVLVYGVVINGLFTVIGFAGVSRSVPIIQTVLFFLTVAGSRLLVSLVLGKEYQKRIAKADRQGVLIYGAGSAGRQLCAALSNSEQLRFIGFLDDDLYLHNSSIDGHKVFNISDLSGLIGRYRVTTILLAIPSATKSRRREILESLIKYRLKVRTLPGMADLAAGKVKASDIADLDVDDLLGRDIVEPDQVLLKKNISNKVVLVTGAGGSIGSELCRQIISCGPSKLILVERNEFALYSIQNDLARLIQLLPGNTTIEIVALLGSVQDARRINEIFGIWLPNSVYHAAAYKHVPIVEHNQVEGIRNNVMGTLTCAQTAITHGVENFVLVSTDKAVRPTNVMGASKRLAEIILQGLAAKQCLNPYSSNFTCFSMVRFGNVLDSSGSVVPLFREQIKNGGPVTLTHIDVTRYFMTIPEAAQLVLQAAAMARGGEVFILDMGQPVRVAHLAKRMIELAGLTVLNANNPDGDIEIQIIGLRPGEKLYEELLIGNNPEATPHSRIMKAKEPYLPFEQIEAFLNTLSIALDSNDVNQIRTLLKTLVVDYQPEDELVDWVYLEQQKVAFEDGLAVA